ncbi:MAG: TonB-dependent receptor, partial [Duganella sp.]
VDRDNFAAYADVEIPLTDKLRVEGAVRFEDYSDFGDTQTGKLSARYDFTPSFALRGSVSTGFRAPSIMDIQNPTAEVRTQQMDDPVLCPSTQPTVAGTGVAVAGRNPDQVCNVLTSYWTKSPNNSFLKPEKSRGFSYGFALEPMKDLSITVDYWGLKLRDVLGAVSIAEIQQNPTKYADQILRDGNGLIDHIVASQANRGMARIRGADISANYRFPKTAVGTFDAKLDGTWYQKNEFQGEKDGVWLQNVGVITNDGRYGSAGPNAGLAGLPQINPRWKHTASIGWRQGDWGATLSQRYNTHLTDLTPRAGSNLTKVSSYSQYNFNMNYKGIPNTTVSLGVNNITKEWPPLTANSTYSGGYVTSMADMLGRVYRMSIEYKF